MDFVVLKLKKIISVGCVILFVASLYILIPNLYGVIPPKGTNQIELKTLSELPSAESDTYVSPPKPIERTQNDVESTNLNTFPTGATDTSINVERVSLESPNKKTTLDQIYEEYKRHEGCEVVFTYADNEQVDDLLIRLANKGVIQNQGNVDSISEAMKDKIIACKDLIKGKTASDYYENMMLLLRESADKGNADAQLSLAIKLQQRIAVAEYQDAEALYIEHIKWLQKSSSQGNANAKIFLALAYLDPINHPEHFDLDKANRLVEEAEKILGKTLDHLRNIIDNF